MRPGASTVAAVPQGSNPILLVPDRVRMSEASGSPAIAAAGAVHDLGNLIQVATSAVTIAARMPDMPRERLEAILARAKVSLEQAGALVRQTIGLVRDRAVVAEETSIAACLSDVRALIETMDQPELVLMIRAEPDLPQVRCDPLGLRSAILNLVFNARDAMAGSGVIMMSARTIAHVQARDAIEIRVSDTGVGMSAATIARAFDPFFTTKSDGLGGVGLPMVEQFVRDAGGNIAIASKPGAGTTVTLQLPGLVPAEDTLEE